MSLPSGSLCNPCSEDRVFLCSRVFTRSSNSLPLVVTGTADRATIIGQFTNPNWSQVGGNVELYLGRSPSVFLEVYQKTTWPQTNSSPAPDGGGYGGCYSPLPTPSDPDPDPFSAEYSITFNAPYGFENLSGIIDAPFTISDNVAPTSCYDGTEYVLDSKTTGIDTLVSNLKAAPFFDFPTEAEFDAAVGYVEDFEGNRYYGNLVDDVLSVVNYSTGQTNQATSYPGLGRLTKTSAGKWMIGFGFTALRMIGIPNEPIATAWVIQLTKLRLKMTAPAYCRLVVVNSSGVVTGTREDLLEPRVYQRDEMVEPLFPEALTYDEEAELSSIPSCFLEVTPVSDGDCFQ